MQPRTYADEVTRILRELLPEALRGAWLIGSLAWDDYRPGNSDIDIMAVADVVPPERRTERLPRVAVRRDGTLVVEDHGGALGPGTAGRPGTGRRCTGRSR